MYGPKNPESLVKRTETFRHELGNVLSHVQLPFYYHFVVWYPSGRLVIPVFHHLSSLCLKHSPGTLKPLAACKRTSRLDHRPTVDGQNPAFHCKEYTIIPIV